MKIKICAINKRQCKKTLQKELKDWNNESPTYMLNDAFCLARIS